MANLKDLFGRNGIASTDGKLAGVVSFPRDPERLKTEIIPVLVHAGINEVAVRVGILDKYTVYAIDLGKLSDEHNVIPMLASALDAGGCVPLDEDLAPDRIWSLASNLVTENLPDDRDPANGTASTNGDGPRGYFGNTGDQRPDV
jgi:hypothetical protein